MPKIHSAHIKTKALKLRKQGQSLSEISNELSISKSTASLWSKYVWLDKTAKEILFEETKKGQNNIVFANAARKTKRKRLIQTIEQTSAESVNSIHFTKDITKLLCAFLFWAEDTKITDAVVFVNSDTKMILTFLHLLRSTFNIDENKFRALLHVHDYHNEVRLKNHWFSITNIPLEQFNKSYKKPNTRVRKRKNYKGCISIRYYDYKIALDLKSTYNAYVNSLP